MTTTIERTMTTQVYRVYIKATPEAIWDALTTSEWTQRYGYGGRVDYELRPGGAYRAYGTEDMLAMGAPDVMIEGEVLEADPPRRLVHTWNALFDPQIAAEAATRLIIEIEEAEGGVTKLTVTHELDGAPMTAALVGGAVPNTGRRMALCPQRPEDAARVRQAARRLIRARRGRADMHEVR